MRCNNYFFHKNCFSSTPFKYTQLHIANRYKSRTFQCNSRKLNFRDCINHTMLYTAEEGYFLEVTLVLALSTSLVVIYSIMLVLYSCINENDLIAWITQVF